jgi:hypothetical protein
MSGIASRGLTGRRTPRELLWALLACRFPATKTPALPYFVQVLYAGSQSLFVQGKDPDFPGLFIHQLSIQKSEYPRKGLHKNFTQE